ncbi:MAG: hypothetical protein MI757_17850 [Pirellulales bacterium]|nr:hypothetical protein [Pirellulales bacterium]
MPEEFDPYQQWLGIAKHEQPANYYRLLGVAELMDDIEAIGNAADRQMNFVRTFQLGKHAEDSQRVLRELAKVKLCLLNPEAKAEYDQQLREANRPPTPAAPAPPKPVAPPPPAPTVAPAQPVPVEPAFEDPEPIYREPAIRRPRDRSGVPQWVWYGLAGVMTIVVVTWMVVRIANSRRSPAPAERTQPHDSEEPDAGTDLPTTSSVTQNLDGTVNLLAALAQPIGQHATRVTEGGETFLTGLESPSDGIQWSFALEKGKRGAFRVEVEYACPEGAEGGEFTVSVNGKQVRGTHAVHPTGGATVFNRVVIGFIKVTQLDGNVLRLSVKSPISSGTTIMNVRAVRLKLQQKGS